MKVAVVLNASASSIAASDASATVSRVREAFERTTLEAEISAISPESFLAAAWTAAASDADVVVFGGGDGTLSTGAAALLGSHKPLGILPLGSLNHFARDVGIPLDLDQAVRTIERGRSGPVAAPCGSRSTGKWCGWRRRNATSSGRGSCACWPRCRTRLRWGRDHPRAHLLAGHLHRGYTGDIRTHHVDIRRGILVAQAGTAGSHRVRNEANGYNEIRLSALRVRFAVRAWDGRRFHEARFVEYVKSGSDWRPGRSG